MNLAPRFSCDVDGILNDYPLCWLKYLAVKCGTLYETVNLAKRGEKDYRIYKDEYRNSSYKANLPVWRNNRDIVAKIISNGYNPIIVTSRPITNEKYAGLYERTFQWLKNTGLDFSDFDYKDPSASYLDNYDNIKFHIDDDPVYAQKVSEKGLKVYLLRNNNWDFSILDGDDKNIVLISNLKEILNYESIF